MNRQKKPFYSLTIRAARHTTLQRLISIALLLGVAPAQASSFEIDDAICTRAVAVDLNEFPEMDLQVSDSSEIFELTTDSPGILTLEVSLPPHGSIAGKLDFPLSGCSRAATGVSILEGFPNRYLARISPGSYLVRWRSPADVAGPFTVRLRFATGHPLRVRPSPATGPRTLTTAAPPFGVKTTEETTDRESDGMSIIVTFPGPESTSTILPGLEGSVIAVDEPGVLEIAPLGAALRLDPGRYPLGLLFPHRPEDFRFYPLCGGATDHSDSFTCATPLSANSALQGSMGPAGEDLDLFTFTLSRRQTVLLEASGSTATYGRLLGEHGQVLAAGEEGDLAEGFQIIRTLPPGRYYVAISGSSYASGSYILETAFADLVEERPR